MSSFCDRRVSCPCVLQVAEELREVVLDARSDEFFRKHALLNFGEVGMSVKGLMEQYQRTESEHKKVTGWQQLCVIGAATGGLPSFSPHHCL